MELSLDRIGDARAVLIAGPTASGKSRAALELAEAAARRGRGTVVVNADSMQVYDALRILTARPDPSQDRRGAAPALRPCRGGSALLGRRVARRRWRRC